MGWFTAKCPVDPETKVWLDDAFAWLRKEIGSDVLSDVEVILPTEEYFPDSFTSSEEDILKMVHRICSYMDVDPDELEVRFFSDNDGRRLHPLAAPEHGSHALGTYQLSEGKYLISLEVGRISNPEVLVATIAHELGHVILHGEGRLDPDYAGHEEMTDLLTVYYGLGVFSANSVISFEQWTGPQSQGWSAERRGYLTEEIYGYALALFALARGERDPEWARYLNINVRSYFKKSLKYLLKTGDFDALSPAYD